MLRSKAVQRKFAVTPNTFAESLLSLIPFQTVNYAQQHTQGSHSQPDLPSLFSWILHQINFKCFSSVEGVRICRVGHDQTNTDVVMHILAHCVFFLMQWYSDKALFLSDLIGRNEAGMRNKMSPQKILAQNSGKIL